MVPFSKEPLKFVAKKRVVVKQPVAIQHEWEEVAICEGKPLYWCNSCGSLSVDGKRVLYSPESLPLDVECY